MVISHDRYFLDSITTKTLELSNGKIESHNGNYTAFIDLKKKDYENKLKAYNLQQSEIKRQEEIIERYRSFNKKKALERLKADKKL